MRKLRVLIACEESQIVCKAFRSLGHESFSCDILPCSGEKPEWHIQGDVLLHLNKGWDLIIAHPPCTHLSSSGQWAYTKGIKDPKLKEEAFKFFLAIMQADCKHIAVENPIGVLSTLYRKPDQIIHPWMFGDKASKATCLWLKNLPLLVPDVVEKPDMEYHTWVDKKTGKQKRMEKWMYDIRTKSHKKRSGIASKTFQGIADAIAKQYSSYLQNI